MNESYINILKESLEKKNQILDQILEQNKLQTQIIKDAGHSIDEFEETLARKAELIDELGRLDIGFDAVYERVGSELSANREKYRSDILVLQELIRKITEKSTRIQTEEARNRQAAINFINGQRKGVQTARTSVKVASDYYKSMSRVNTIDPQMMDKRK